MNATGPADPARPSPALMSVLTTEHYTLQSARVPLVGAILGVAWLNEPLTGGLAFGLVAILMGVGLPIRASQQASGGRVISPVATESEPFRT